MPIGDRAKSKIQEDLVTLYLRLNGFFASSFIVHSPVHGQNFTEVDVLAVRHPFSSEPEREIGPHELLDVSQKYTELVLCEVKSNGQKMHFNPALLEGTDRVQSVLRWSGLFPEKEIEPLAKDLVSALCKQSESFDGPPTVLATREVRIRGLMFNPERNRRHPKNDSWYIDGSALMQYVWQCFCPQTPRHSCATTYDLQAWGHLEVFVRYFKSRDASGGPGSMKDVYAFIEADVL